MLEGVTFYNVYLLRTLCIRQRDNLCILYCLIANKEGIKRANPIMWKCYIETVHYTQLVAEALWARLHALWVQLVKWEGKVREAINWSRIISIHIIV